jgi:hypothetical protein
MQRTLRQSFSETVVGQSFGAMASEFEIKSHQSRDSCRILKYCRRTGRKTAGCRIVEVVWLEVYRGSKQKVGAQVNKRNARPDLA